MSAFIVSRAHIDVLVQALCESELVIVDPDEVGRTLWRENLRSVACRYPDDGDGDRPGPIGFRDAEVDTYTYRRPGRRVDRNFIVTQAHCYAYQSCECPDWETSTAHAWIELLYTALGTDYRCTHDDRAPWGAEEEHVHVTAGV